MTTKGFKAMFIRELCNNVRDELVAKIARMPPEWDGRELRELVADSFEACRMPVDDKKRRRDYRNYVIVNNL